MERVWGMAEQSIIEYEVRKLGQGMKNTWGKRAFVTPFGHLPNSSPVPLYLRDLLYLASEQYSLFSVEAR